MFHRLFAEVIDDLGFEPEEFIEAGDQMVVVCHVRGRGKGSGIEVEMNGLIVYLCAHPTRELALGAIGLPA